jgi:hypothetical protein
MEFRLELIDRTALVTRLQAADFGSPEFAGRVEGAHLGADRRSVVLGWSSLPCERNPVLTVTGDTHGLTLSIDRRTPPRLCSTASVFYAVKLWLSAPIATAQLSAR